MFFALPLIALAALLAYAGTRPPAFRYQRSIHIAAPIARIVAQIDDFHAWPSWSPWEKLDPSMKRIISGAASGPGAIYEWDGNNKAGAGRMEILSSDSALIRIKLDFFRPFKANNTAEFAMSSNGSGTDLTWSMFGPSPFMSKLMGVFINFDKLIGKDFEAGLVALKRTAEQA